MTAAANASGACSGLTWPTPGQLDEPHRQGNAAAFDHAWSNGHDPIKGVPCTTRVGTTVDRREINGLRCGACMAAVPAGPLTPGSRR